MQILMPIHCFVFEIQIIKNGFAGPISYRVFRFEKVAPGGKDQPRGKFEDNELKKAWFAISC